MTEERTAVDRRRRRQRPPAERRRYDDENVQVLRDAAHIRQRPGMYIGDTGAKGLHHLVYELVHNSVDEALAGYCKHIHVTHQRGRQPQRRRRRPRHPRRDAPRGEAARRWKWCMTTVGAGGKFDKRRLQGLGRPARHRRQGRHRPERVDRGRGAPQRPGLRAGVRARQGDHRGQGDRRRPATAPAPRSPSSPTRRSSTTPPSTTTRWRPACASWPSSTRAWPSRCIDERTGKEETFKYDGGIAEFVEYLNRTEETLHKPIYIDKTVDDVRVEVALQYTTGEEERVRCYANNAYNPGGGTHLSGFRAALTRTLNAYGNKEELFKNVTPIGEDFREGLTAVVSVQVPEPQFESQTKIRLNNPEVEGIVASVVNEHLAQVPGGEPQGSPEDHEEGGRWRPRPARRRPRPRRRSRTARTSSAGGGLPGKLMDCTTPRPRRVGAVPGRGRVGRRLGRERPRPHATRRSCRCAARCSTSRRPGSRSCSTTRRSAASSRPSASTSATARTSSKLRYGKIVILTDADVDGQHIRTLLLTFFYRQMRKLIEDGHIYVARPPLFKVTQKKNVRFVQTAEEMDTRADGARPARHEAARAAAAEAGGAGGAARARGRPAGRAGAGAAASWRTRCMILERRGLNLATFLAQATRTAALPLYRVLLGGTEHWFYTPSEVDAFRQARAGQRWAATWWSATSRAPAGPTATATPARRSPCRSCTRCAAINRGLEQLREFGLDGADLVPLPRVAGREPPLRFVLENGDSKQVAAAPARPGRARSASSASRA